MKIKSFFAALLLSSLTLNAAAQVSFGQSERFNDGWMFFLEEGSGMKEEGIRMKEAGGGMKEEGMALPDYDDSGWRRLSLPHDWSVESPMSPQLASCTGYLPGGIGWYRKHFRMDDGLGMKDESAFGHKESSLISHPSSLFLYFEGIYNRSSVYLNGHLLGTRPNGYASVLYDLTPYLNQPGEDNVLAVRVDHSRYADSRWYTGSGIYRDVWLIRAPKTHLAQWGSAWRVKSLSKSKAVVEVDIETDGTPLSHPSSSLQAEVLIRDAEGREVARTTTAIGCPEKKTVTLTLRNPHRWSLADTYLYHIETRLWLRSQEVKESRSKDNSQANDKHSSCLLDSLSPCLLDKCRIRMGLRTFTFSSDRGFALNGEWTKVKGVCLHHDAGALGAAMPREVWQLRLQELKKIGVNAIRMSHNPQAPMLYDLCDEMGFLVMDEASDEWEFPKRKWLEGWNRGTPGYDGSYDFFEEWIERDVADMVRRDRNHPSVFLWSIGNEVDYPNDPYSHPILDGDGTDFTQPIYGGYKPEQPNAERIGKIARRLAAVVRKEDPSRAVTGALAGVVMSNQTEYPEAVDVVGYNYTESRYQEDHARYPKRVIYGSENRHDLAAWQAVSQNDHIFGQFLWTGADYLGESGPWPARGSSAGLVDLASQRKPNGWYRASLWSPEPVVYIGTYPIGNRREGDSPARGRRRGTPVSTYATDTWNYREGQRVRVVCYSNQPDLRLTLNGQPIGGEAQLDTATSVRYWDIDYHPGTLRAEAVAPATATAASYEIRTSGRPYALRVADITPAPLPSSPQPATHILLIEVIDEDGRPVPLADNMITCTVTGPARLLALENGNIEDTSYTPPLRSENRHAAGRGFGNGNGGGSLGNGFGGWNQRGHSRRAFQGRLTAYVLSYEPETPAFSVRVSSPLLQEAEVAIGDK